MFYESVQLLGIGNGPFYRLKFLIYTVNWLLISRAVHWIWNATHEPPTVCHSHYLLAVSIEKVFRSQFPRHSYICDDEWAQFSQTTHTHIHKENLSHTFIDVWSWCNGRFFSRLYFTHSQLIFNYDFMPEMNPLLEHLFFEFVWSNSCDFYALCSIKRLDDFVCVWFHR